jgi:hypothetical protein
MPWFLGIARKGSRAIGLSEPDANAMIEIASAPAEASDPSSRMAPGPNPRKLPIGATREIRCHRSDPHDAHTRHDAHTPTPHTKIGAGTWRCDVCGRVKTRETEADIVKEVQRLKDVTADGGLTNKNADRGKRALASPELLAMEDEWKSLSEDHVDLNRVL